MTAITIVPVERLELALVPRPWPFARDKRAEIDAHFAALQRANPALWNGRVLLLHDHSIAGAVFHGAYLETDYASMLAWREWESDSGIRNCFGMGVAEDPATGSAAAAFAGLLASSLGDGIHTTVIEQGYDMGRPSLIRLTTTVEAGRLVSAAIGGDAVVITEGTLEA